MQAAMRLVLACVLPADDFGLNVVVNVVRSHPSLSNAPHLLSFLPVRPQAQVGQPVDNDVFEEVIEVIESEDEDQDADQDAEDDMEQEQRNEMDDWLASDGDVSAVSWACSSDEDSFTSSSDISMSEEEVKDTPCPAAAAAARRVISDDEDE